MKKITAKTIQQALNRTARINSKSRRGLTRKQVGLLWKYMAGVLSGNRGTGTYRYLIYDILGGVAYCDGMDMDLIALNNWLGDMQDYLTKHPNTQERFRKIYDNYFGNTGN